jgi:DNA-binding XRE family transcriptional regulator
MSADFSQLIADIEQEARDEGPQAVRELEQLREIRREGKLSQRDLAKLSGVPQSEISRIETGTSNPTYATITALLRPLGKRVQLVDDGKIVARRGGGGRSRSAKRPAKLASGPGKPTAKKAATKG